MKMDTNLLIDENHTDGMMCCTQAVLMAKTFPSINKLDEFKEGEPK